MASVLRLWRDDDRFGDAVDVVVERRASSPAFRVRPAFDPGPRLSSAPAAGDDARGVLTAVGWVSGSAAEEACRHGLDPTRSS